MELEHPSDRPAATRSAPPLDIEKGAQPEVTPKADRHPQLPQDGDPLQQGPEEGSMSDFKALSWLDRFLALWIFLAMAIGIILGNFVPSTGPALQRGKFVDVSVPIGISDQHIHRYSACQFFSF